MGLPEKYVEAMYIDPGVERYRGNPLIEALPPIMDLKTMKARLAGKVAFNPEDCFASGHLRAHQISCLLDDFFQPLSVHKQLEEKISIMMRMGYVGRNIENGSLNKMMQEGYLRIMAGANNDFRFSQTNSTAKSFSLIGCSGSGKSLTVNRILATYPEVIYHPKYNFIQLPYIRIQCPSNGSLKSLCLNFFRAVDQAIDSGYEKKYVQKRLGTEVLLSMMGQVATQRAGGILVIDEIQRLTVKRNITQEQMLEFFVALVNVVGVPVVLIGTPKARPMFEMELQAGRRSAGFGAPFWEPMKPGPKVIDSKTGKLKRTEWRAFTDKLWIYQWLTKRDEILSEELRDCWFELSQGVLDIVVKLFVLAQLRAIATGLERITEKLLRTVYEQELKPVHPMLKALREGNVEKIVQYSDMKMPHLDKRLLELRREIEEKEVKVKSDIDFSGNEKAMRLYTLLEAMGCESSLLKPLVQNVFKQSPELSMPELTKIVLEWYSNPPTSKINPVTKVKKTEWHTLDTEDLRFKYSQAEKGDLYKELTVGKEVYDVQAWLKSVG